MKINRIFFCVSAALAATAISVSTGAGTISTSSEDGSLLSKNVEALTTTIEGSQLVHLCAQECAYSYYYDCVLYTNIGTITCLNGVPRKWL